MPAKIATTTLARRFRRLRAESNICWTPLVFLWIDTTNECENPICDDAADVKQAHLINGEIVSVQMCFNCALYVARETGMIEDDAQFATVCDRPI